MNTTNTTWSETDEREWRAFREHFEVGQLVEGIVVHDLPFGLFVDIGHPRFLALAEWLHSDLRAVARPAPGHSLIGVVTDFSNRQIRLLVNPASIQAAESLHQVGALPPAEREAFLWQALLSQESFMAEAAIWHVRYLPFHERGAFLRQALHLNHSGAAARAVGRVVDLPQEERAPFLQYVLQHEDQGIAALAVWKMEYLTMTERRLFLQEAALHPFPEVNERASFELGRLFSDKPLDG